MNNKSNPIEAFGIKLLHKTVFFLVVCSLLLFLCGCRTVKKLSGNPCISNSTSPAQEIVDDSACALMRFRLKTDSATIDYLLYRAKGVFIFPEQYKAAFMVGIKGGTGVLCVKDSTGFWNGPAFYSLSGIDWGLQGGFSGSTVLVFFFDYKSLESVYSGEFKLSLEADFVLGEVQDQSFRDTMGIQGSILTLIYRKGALAAMTCGGGVFSPRHVLNQQYYGKDVTVRELLSTHKYDKPEADILLNALLGI